MVYVDALQVCIPNPQWRWSRSCHLMADTEPEIHIFAGHLGLKREWFQDTRMPHYDLTPAMRQKAVALGAKPADKEDLVRLFRELYPRQIST